MERIFSLSRRDIRPLFYLVVAITFCHPSSAQGIEGPSRMLNDLKQVVLLQPTGEMVDSLPEMKLFDASDERYDLAMRNVTNSFIHQFLDVYFLAQIYLQNLGETDTIYPAYLALTENQGGFAKFGFALAQGGSHLLLEEAPYIDITVGQGTGGADRLMSISQLYPHEMGHVLVHLLCSEDTIASNTRSVNMHFFSLITDYSTAFNEGFAEHIENVSRHLEENEEIRNGTVADLSEVALSSQQTIKGFERDFRFPMRLGYYKASMLGWYQKFEDYKRHEHAFSGDISFKNATLALANVNDQITYRNSGVRLNTEDRRNLVQLHATEGAVSAFFTHLTISSLAEQYQEPEFYRPFLEDTTLLDGMEPTRLFTPLQNQFMKYFVVMQKHVTFNNSSGSQLADFIDGYMQTFPEEKEDVHAIFEKALHRPYANNLPPPLWIMVEPYEHRLLVFDPFDAVTVPIYTFDLNAAEVPDLLTVGLQTDEAERIVAHREARGFYTSLEQLREVEGIPPAVADRLITLRLDEDRFEEVLEDFNPKLTIASLVAKPLEYIFLRGGGYFLLIVSIMFASFRRWPVNNIVLALLRYLLLWVLLILTTLIVVFISPANATVFVVGLVLSMALLMLVLYRHKPCKRARSLILVGSMAVVLLLSVI